MSNSKTPSKTEIARAKSVAKRSAKPERIPSASTELVSEAEWQHRGSSGFIRQIRPEPDALRGDERRRNGHDDGIGHHRAERGFDRKTFSSMIDEHDRTVEPNWQACSLRRDYGAVSFNDPPVDAGIGIMLAVLHRDKTEFDTVDIGADRIESGLKRQSGSRRSAALQSASLGPIASKRSWKHREAKANAS
jgi:hypothetical protein